MKEFLTGGEPYTYPHDRPFLKGLGFGLRDIAGLYCADFAARIVELSPLNGGAWPSDIEISRRLTANGLNEVEFAASL